MFLHPHFRLQKLPFKKKNLRVIFGGGGYAKIVFTWVGVLTKASALNDQKRNSWEGEGDTKGLWS